MAIYSEILNYRDGINRRMRYGGQEMENLATRFFTDVSTAYFDAVSDIYDIIDELPTFATARRNARKNFSSDNLKTYDLEPKAFEDDEFARIFGSGKNRDFDRAMRRFLRQLIGRAKTTIQADGSRDIIYDRHLFSTIETTFRKAFDIGKSEWNQLSAAMQEEFPFTATRNAVINPNQAWIRELYSGGFERVTASVTVNHSAFLKRQILRDVKREIPWTEIAQRLHTTVSEAGLYHWNRLVRTEMARAIDVSAVERYKQMGAQIEKYDMSVTGCVICQGWNLNGRGYYVLGDGPQVVSDTHPNCRCSKTPVWSLPRGASLHIAGGAGPIVVDSENYL